MKRPESSPYASKWLLFLCRFLRLHPAAFRDPNWTPGKGVTVDRTFEYYFGYSQSGYRSYRKCWACGVHVYDGMVLK